MFDQIPESDWKKFKNLRPLALKRYCDRVLNDVNNIIGDNEKSSHERYLKIYKLMRNRDKNLAQMFDGFARSKAKLQLMMFYGEDLISDDEVDQFSKETRNSIYRIKKDFDDE